MHSTGKYTKQFNSTVIEKIWRRLRKGLEIITLVYSWFTIRLLPYLLFLDRKYTKEKCIVLIFLPSNAFQKQAQKLNTIFVIILCTHCLEIKENLFEAFYVKFIVHLCLISIQPVFDSIRNLSIIYAYVLLFSLAQKINQSMCIISDKNLIFFIHPRWKE